MRPGDAWNPDLDRGKLEAMTREIGLPEVIAIAGNDPGRPGSGADRGQDSVKTFRNLATIVRHDRRDGMVTERLTARRSWQRVEWGMWGRLVVSPRSGGLVSVRSRPRPRTIAPMRPATSSPASNSPTAASTAPTARAASTPTDRLRAISDPGGTGTALTSCCRPARCDRSGDRYCASVRGLPFEPCFHVDRTSQSASAARCRAWFRLLRFQPAQLARGFAGSADISAAWCPRLGGRRLSVRSNFAKAQARRHSGTFCFG